MIVPESFTFAARFINDSIKSPKIAKIDPFKKIMVSII